MVRQDQSTEAEEDENTGAGYLMRFKERTEPTLYHVKRQDRTIKTFQPQYTTNIDIDFDVTVKGEFGSQVTYSLSNFKGVDLDDSNSKHLKNIAKTIEQERLIRKFNEFGPTTELEFINNNPGGWAGMMMARALGRYEFSFMDTRFPKGKRDVGGSWRAPSDLAREIKFGLAVSSGEDVYGSSGVKESGEEAEFTLTNVKEQGDVLIGEIHYEASGDVEMNFESGLIGDQKSIEHITVRGTIWLDLTTGWPVKAKIVRRRESSSVDGVIIEEYTTFVERS